MPERARGGEISAGRTAARRLGGRQTLGAMPLATRGSRPRPPVGTPAPSPLAFDRCGQPAAPVAPPPVAAGLPAAGYGPPPGLGGPANGAARGGVAPTGSEFSALIGIPVSQFMGGGSHVVIGNH